MCLSGQPVSKFCMLARTEYKILLFCPWFCTHDRQNSLIAASANGITNSLSPECSVIFMDKCWVYFTSFAFFFFKENCRSPLRTIGYHPFLCWCSECSNFTWPMNYTEMAVTGGLRGLGEGPCFLPGLAHRWSPGRGCSRYCLLQVGGTMPCLLLRAYWAMCSMADSGVFVQKCMPVLPPFSLGCLLLSPPEHGRPLNTQATGLGSSGKMALSRVKFHSHGIWVVSSQSDSVSGRENFSV